MAENIFLPALISITIAALIVEIVRLRSPRVNRRLITVFRALLREREISTLTGSTYLFLASSIVFVLCDKSIAAVALAFVVVGDPVAGMVGERWGRLKVSSGKRSGHGLGDKSLEGSVPTLWLVVLGAICATVVESLSLPVNDNLSIPLVAAGVMSLAHAIWCRGGG